MVYIGNIAEFIKYKLKNITKGYEVYNYVDKPDLNMNQLMAEIEKRLRKKFPFVHLPYPLGMLGGYCFDILSKVISKKYAVSYACTAPQFDETKLHDSGVVAPYILFYRD